MVIAGPPITEPLAESHVAESHVAAPDPLGPMPAAMAVETTAALARLGDPVEILRVASLEELARVASDPSIDLVLIDRVEAETTGDWLGALGHQGPPSVVVVEDPTERAALDAFRGGASDCIRFGSDFDRVLPVVLLEQVRRWRADRQRRVSEQRIEWLESLYTGIVSEMPAALALTDQDGLILAVNPEFDRLFPSRSPSGGQELIEARLPAELVRATREVPVETGTTGGLPLAGPESAPNTEPDAGEQSASAAPTKAVLVRVEAAAGKPRAFELRRRPLAQDGRQVLLISDVTESEWLAETLQAVRRDARGIVDNINSAILVVDPDGSINFANEAAEHILGASAAALSGRRIADWFGREGSELSPIEACLEEGTRSRGAETRLRRGDGHWIPVGVSCSPRLDAAGRERGVVAVFQDLSEIKELEEQVRQNEKMASIGQLAAGVAHEVNNPMGFIHANLHQMTEYLDDLEGFFEATDRLQQLIGEGDLGAIQAQSAQVKKLSSEIDLDFVRTDFRKALGESVEGAERIRHIVKDLRDFSRPDLPDRSSADINQALDSTANIVWAMMKHEVRLEKAYGDLPLVEAYPMQLKQVFMNLLVNAYQAIESRDDGAPGVIRIETEADDREVRIRISDSGVGMEPSVRARIFDPFYTTKAIGVGTGLGLSTSFTIVKRHGGHFQVTSRVGQGSCFELALPLRPDLSPAPSEHDEGSLR